MNNNQHILYETAWQFAMACLWPRRKFSIWEKLKYTRSLRACWPGNEDIFAAYIEFCERVVLYYYYLIETKGKLLLPDPESWLKATHGYAFSGLLYKGLLDKRKDEPLFFHPVRSLAEAILEMTEDGSEEKFHYWEVWFRARNAHRELQIFYQYISKFHV